MAGRSVNKVILVGNLGQDPELKYTASGQAVANFSLATNERWKDKNGEFQERTEWHRLVCWAKLAETASKYLNKGSSVYIEGRLQTRSWDDKEGKKHFATEVIVQDMVMLGGRGAGQAAGQGAAMGSARAAAAPASDAGSQEPDYSGPSANGVEDEDLPF